MVLHSPKYFILHCLFCHLLFCLMFSFLFYIFSFTTHIRISTMYKNCLVFIGISEHRVCFLTPRFFPTSRSQQLLGFIHSYTVVQKPVYYNCYFSKSFNRVTPNLYQCNWDYNLHSINCSWSFSEQLPNKKQVTVK